MRIGIIGTGNIGGMLTAAFAQNSHLSIYINNRTRAKAERLANGMDNVFIADRATDAVTGCDIVFVCTKAEEGLEVLQEIGSILSKDQVLVTTISSIPIAKVQQMTTAGVAKVLPSIAQITHSGVLLVTYGDSISGELKERLYHLLSEISTPFAVEEEQVRVASDLTSCGPAFIAYLLTQWSEAAGNTKQITPVTAEHLLAQTVTGLATLLQSGYTFSDIMNKVAVPGGVTQAGIESLKKDAPELFANLHRTTAQFADQSAVASIRGS